MRHRVAGRRLGRTKEHRLAMRRNMVASLFEHERISTTVEKAKEIKSFAEKLITLGKTGTLAARRRAISMLGNRAIVANEGGETVKKGTVISKLFSEIGPRYLERAGGYTRIIRLSQRRLGDNGQLALLQLVGKDEVSKKKSQSKTSKAAKKVEVAEDVIEVSQDAVEVVEADTEPSEKASEESSE